MFSEIRKYNQDFMNCGYSKLRPDMIKYIQKEEMKMRNRRHPGLFPKQKASIDYVVKDVKTKDYQWITKVVLFGSCATNRNKYSSDVDILYVTSEEYQGYNDEMHHLKCVLCGLPDDAYAEIDPKFMSEKYVENQKSTFLESVNREGVVLWTRSHI